MARAFKVGVQLHPQATTMDEIRAAARRYDEMGVDSLWTWDHFFPLHGEDQRHFEGWTTLTAMACDTSNATIGHLVNCNSYRNPELLTDMARTLDHVCGGRAILGIGAGWFQRDYEEYGYEFGRPIDRLRALEAAIPRIKDRRSKLDPPPVGDLPLMIGGGGEKVTLRIVAEQADMWNSTAGLAAFAHKNKVLTDWCHKVGRDPSDVERTAAMGSNLDEVSGYLAAGAEHLIVMHPAPFYDAPIAQLLELAEGR